MANKIFKNENMCDIMKMKRQKTRLTFTDGACTVKQRGYV